MTRKISFTGNSNGLHLEAVYVKGNLSTVDIFSQPDMDDFRPNVNMPTTVDIPRETAETEGVVEVVARWFMGPLHDSKPEQHVTKRVIPLGA